MPKTWPVCNVDDVRRDTPDGLATGPFGSSVSSKFFQTEGIPMIRGSNLSEAVGERLVERDYVFMSEDKAAEYPRAIARRGDIVFTCWGTIGQVGLIDKRSQYDRYLISNKQMKLSPDPAKADSLFLYYMFASPTMRAMVKSICIGSSVPGFNLSQLRSLSFPLPPLLEQRAIAGVLGALDDKIELNRRTSRTLERLARAIFRAWFVDFEPVKAKAAGARFFPGMPPKAFNALPSRFVGSELGHVPEGWTVLPLDEAVEVNPSRRLVKGVLAPYLDMGQMPTAGHAPISWTEREAGSGARFMNGDTLVARITPCLENGKTAYVDFLREGQVAWGSTEYIVFRPKPPIPTLYAYLLARTPEFRAFAIQNMTGTSGRQRVPFNTMSQFKVAIGPSPVMKAFGEVVEPLFTRSSASVRESRSLSTLRDYLLPKLLSGELQVRES